MRLRWTLSAANDLESIHNYLSEYHPAFARPTVRTLYAAIQSLRNLPERGRVGDNPETRGLVLTKLPYILVYRIADDAVEIIRIYHWRSGSQPQRLAGCGLTPPRIDSPILSCLISALLNLP